MSAPTNTPSKSSPPPANKRRAPVAPREESPLPPSATSTASVRPPPMVAKRSIPPLLKVALGGAFVIAASVLVAWGARRYVLTTPRFATRTVLIEGESHLSAEQVATLGGISIGGNVFALDLDAAKSKIEQNPWVQQATVVRKLPSTVHVAIVEREPSGLALLGGDLYLVTRDGEPFKRFEAVDPSDLPLITGIPAEKVASDRPGVVAKLRSLVDVIGEFDRVGISKSYPLQELHIDMDDTLIATVGREAIQLHLGPAPYRGKLEQAARVLGEVRRRKANVSTIFLDNSAHPERVVARMR